MSQGCKYCKDVTSFPSTFGSLTIKLKIIKNQYNESVIATQNGYSIMRINYCPFCGTDLQEDHSNE